MPRTHNAIAQATRFLNALRGAVGGDRELNVERLSETLQPTLDLWRQPEWAFPRGDRPMIAQLIRAGAAAGTHFRWRLPASSGMIAVIERVFMRAETNAGRLDIRISDNATDLANVITSCNRDRRQGFALQSVTRVVASMDSSVPIGGDLLMGVQCAVGEELDFSVPLIMAHPSDVQTIELGTGDANVGVTGFIAWRERQLLPGEDRPV